MTLEITYQDWRVDDPTHIDAITTVWNEACGPELAISNRFVSFNTKLVRGGAQVGQIAYQGAQPIGFVLASTLSHEPLVAADNVGWIDALAVAPAVQRQGIGSTLLTWAEDWLAQQGRHKITFGASQRPFAPGLPVELNMLPFFSRHGYVSDRTSWDTAANLATYQTPETLSKGYPDIKGVVRPAQKGEEQALLEFFQREFPGRWRFEFENFISEPAYRFSDFMILWTERGIDGFCRLTFEDSSRPLERFFPYQLPRPWGQLGPIGVSAAQRGHGYGLAILDAGLRRLHNNGVNGCIIDWTGIVDFYAKFGFQPYREYHMLGKTL
ncbi:MAG: GNAT family N-acetyltransferase [Chloroflexi bacterium]|nr:GNAT family N-acetyltransferase [Chloroflexota bacterium]